METFELTDGVVLLRAPGPADVDRIDALCQDPAIQEWTTVPSPYTREDAASFVSGFVGDGWARGSSLNWAVRDAADDVLVGMVGLGMEGAGSAEIGYWLAPEARGRGLMSRSVDLVLDAAFGRLELVRVFWRAFVGNAPSRAVAERAGFRVEGELRLGGVQRGVRRDEWVGSLLATDPRPRRVDARPAAGASGNGG
ncbi:GNAT family N-acetyltransferase [Cellulomonas sp. ACRRI]|uniref:GNAT family N-acetyltransferase n=1 Tax=Cellulomonas sp. ACRRI TaxID=2918188 RepID=UPI001EF24F99|nr:GNAT family protein [Cellulomonas sp. ACRRI]MCG7287093.1 GNAT family N-acetyltransferase [Cellulomonas sp. ACRRI]